MFNQQKRIMKKSMIFSIKGLTDFWHDTDFKSSHNEKFHFFTSSNDYSIKTLPDQQQSECRGWLCGSPLILG